jgi:predicted 2-oxoglutarate/Fe(II)-dependent dioxygenase YbiX/peroxiredoxin
MPSSAGEAPTPIRPPAAALAPGDRVPNFVLSDQSGAFRAFYERARGNPLALVVLADQAAATELEGAAASRAAREAAGIDLIAISPEEAGPLEALAERIGLAAPVLTDPKRSITSALAKAAGLVPAPALWLLLDPNQRLLEARAGAGLARWAVERLIELHRPEPAQRLSSVAPVLIVPNVLGRDICRALIERWERLGHEEGSVNSIVDGEEVHRVYHGMKKRRDHAIQDEALLKTLVAMIGRRIAPELDKAFGFGSFRFDRFIVTCYDAERGDYFRRHRDNSSPGTADRRYALTLNLNSEDYEGGELLFPEYGPHRYRPGTGGAILFSCSLLHEALPVTRGRRFTLLSFLRNPERAAAAARASRP